MMVDKSITKSICRVGGLDISFLVLWNNQDRPSETRKTYKGSARDGNSDIDYSYLYLSHSGMLQIRCIGDTYERDKTDSIYITPKNVLRFMKGLKKAVELFDRDDIFYFDESNKLSMYPNNHTISISHLGDNRHVRIVPSIVEDKNGSSYEGAIMYINTLHNKVYLTYDELCLVLYIIQKTDFFLYTQALLMYNEMRKSTTANMENSAIGKGISSQIISRMDSIKAKGD